MPTARNKNKLVISNLSSFGVGLGAGTNFSAVFLSPREEPAFAVTAPHERLNILTAHSLRTHAILERIHSFEIYAVFM